MTGIARSGVISPDHITALGYHPSPSPFSSTNGSPSATAYTSGLDHYSRPVLEVSGSGPSTPFRHYPSAYPLQYQLQPHNGLAPSMITQVSAHQQPQYQQTLVTEYVVNGKPGVYDGNKRRTKSQSKTIYSATHSGPLGPSFMVPTTPVQEHPAWEMSTPIHVTGQMQLPTPPMTNEDNTSITPKPSNQSLQTRPSVASLTSISSAPNASTASNPSQQSPQKSPRKRELKIKRSEKEGRRLVFPDALSSPETSAKDLASETEDDAPSTPKKKRSPRVVPVSGLNQTPRGTAHFGKRDILQTELSWLQPLSPESQAGLPEDDEELVRAGLIKRGPLPAGMTHSASRFEGLSKAERKRKRLQAFRNLSLDAGQSRENLLTTLKGVGRVACGQDLAARFLVPTGTVVQVESQENSACTTIPTKDSGRATNLLQPAWPDEHFPWSSADFERKQQQDNSTRIGRARRLALVEKYLDQVSDDEGDEFDPRTALRRFIAKGPVGNPSDAREAIFHVKKDGKPLISTETFQLPPDIPIASYDDETGCVCRGANEDGGAMVCCDSCGGWYHMTCVGINTEEDLGEQWYCWECDDRERSALRNSTPQADRHLASSSMSHPLQPHFIANEEVAHGYHAHSSDTALAPSPIFSTSGKFLVPDTPGFFMNTPRIPSNANSYTPRMPSSSSVMTKYGTPATPSSRARTVSYAEHYNVCQTPGAGASELDYAKVYATPKFEDLFDTGFTPLRASPTPGGVSASSEARRIHAELRTPTTTQNFFRDLHTGGSQPTPGLEHLSSAISNHSTYPVSPANFPPKMNPAISELTTSPSPLRSHRRQVSFGNRVTSQSYSASHLRESVIIEEKSAVDSSSPDKTRGKGRSYLEHGAQPRRPETRFTDGQ
ncbi:hypothetical protein QFC21_003357 [Naganishia friedmannii]|uniref:Uncharacterized protein n=1 Tax=Naganishia friedmannii TaxID=89922 RepID=A0ACC2VP05_9TREE|nr:hypothetical protein QFC21_003357 [Naganishia friedmannii]